MIRHTAARWNSVSTIVCMRRPYVVGLVGYIDGSKNSPKPRPLGTQSSISTKDKPEEHSSFALPTGFCSTMKPHWRRPRAFTEFQAASPFNMSSANCSPTPFMLPRLDASTSCSCRIKVDSDGFVLRGLRKNKSVVSLATYM